MKQERAGAAPRRAAPHANRIRNHRRVGAYETFLPRAVRRRLKQVPRRHNRVRSHASGEIPSAKLNRTKRLGGRGAKETRGKSISCGNDGLIIGLGSDLPEPRFAKLQIKAH